MPFAGLTQAVRAQISYKRSSGRSQDTQTNTMHFVTSSDTRAVLTTNARNFINTMLAGIDAWMDAEMFVSPATIEWFDLLELEPRVPYQTDTTALTMRTGSVSLPMEVSMVMSFQGTPVSGFPNQRRMGRIFLPTFSNAATVEASGTVQWNPTTVLDIWTVMSAAYAGIGATGSRWAVFSPTTYDETPGLTLDKLRQAMTSVTQAWIDFEPDIQRRRGTNFGTKQMIVP